MSDIAINPVTRRVQFTGNTGTGPYAFNFNVLQSSDIVVYKNNVLLTETTDYTVSIAANGTGNITMVVALVLTDILTIIGGRELSRTTDFVTAGDLLASSLNEQLDSNVIMSQQLDERFGRTLAVPPGDEDKTLDLPLAADRADKIILFDESGNVTAAAPSDFFGNAVLGGNFIVNTATGNGSQTAFGLTVAPGIKTNIQIHIEGVYQNKSTFSLSGSTVTFTEAPPLNAAIEFMMGESVTTITGDASAITYNQGGTGAQDRTLTSKLQDTVSVKDFGAVGDGVTDDTAAIQAAVAALASNSFENSKGIYFPAGIYKITSTIDIDLSTSSLTLYSDTKATISVDVPDGGFAIDVDYSTGGTANFPSFNMTNIGIADLADPRNVKNGLRTKRVIGSRFTKCDFEYLNIAVDMGDDSNLNTFDLCQWRGNVTGYKSTAGVASHNNFYNCQWRYHSGTAFDATNSAGNIIVSGDFEPENVSPVIIANGLKVIDCRFERNVSNGQPAITVLSNNELDFEAHADGSTQFTPFYDVEGSNNKLKLQNSNGGTAVFMNDGATNNETEISKFESLISGGSVIYDEEVAEPSNIIKTKGSMQNNKLGDMVEVNTDELVSSDLTTWTATNCTVTSLGNGGYTITSTGSGACNIAKTLTGTYTDLMASMTTLASNASGQATFDFDSGTSGDCGTVAVWPAVQKRVICSSFYTDTFTNPVITISLDNTGGSGSAVKIYNFRLAEGKTPD